MHTNNRMYSTSYKHFTQLHFNLEHETRAQVLAELEEYYEGEQFKVISVNDNPHRKGWAYIKFMADRIYDPGNQRESCEFEDTYHQLRRYGGAPDQRIIAMLQQLDTLNDDLAHGRGHREYKSSIDKLVILAKALYSIELEEHHRFHGAKEPKAMSDREWSAQSAGLREGCTTHVPGVGDI